MPATSPTVVKMRASESLLIIASRCRCRRRTSEPTILRSRHSRGRSGHVDAARAAVRRLRNDDGEDAVAQVGADVLDFDRRGQGEGPRELAVAALDLVVLLARDAGVAPALQGDAAVLHFDAHLVAGTGRAVPR